MNPSTIFVEVTLQGSGNVWRSRCCLVDWTHSRGREQALDAILTNFPERQLQAHARACTERAMGDLGLTFGNLNGREPEIEERAIELLRESLAKPLEVSLPEHEIPWRAGYLASTEL